MEFSPIDLQQIKDETAKDGIFQFLTHQAVQGWPDNIKKVHPKIMLYWNNRDDIFIQEGILVLRSQILNYIRITLAADNLRNP